MHTAIEAAFAAVAKVHGLMSFHEATSDLGRLNSEASARPVGVHAWTFRVLEAAVELHRRSAGAFDIAVAPILQDLGLLPPDERQARSAPSPNQTPACRGLVTHRIAGSGQARSRL